MNTAVTLFGGYLGAAPPPTMARMLHLNSISTMPMPPLLKPLQNCKSQVLFKVLCMSTFARQRRRLRERATMRVGHVKPEAVIRGTTGRANATHEAACKAQSLAMVPTRSLNGSQLYTRKPLLVPQAKQPLSWLKPMWSSSTGVALLSIHVNLMICAQEDDKLVSTRQAKASSRRQSLPTSAKISAANAQAVDKYLEEAVLRSSHAKYTSYKLGIALVLLCPRRMILCKATLTQLVCSAAMGASCDCLGQNFQCFCKGARTQACEDSRLTHLMALLTGTDIYEQLGAVILIKNSDRSEQLCQVGTAAPLHPATRVPLSNPVAEEGRGS